MYQRVWVHDSQDSSRMSVFRFFVRCIVRPAAWSLYLLLVDFSSPTAAPRQNVPPQESQQPDTLASSSFTVYHLRLPHLGIYAGSSNFWPRRTLLVSHAYRLHYAPGRRQHKVIYAALSGQSWNMEACSPVLRGATTYFVTYYPSATTLADNGCQRCNSQCSQSLRKWRSE